MNLLRRAIAGLLLRVAEAFGRLARKALPPGAFRADPPRGRHPTDLVQRARPPPRGGAI